MSTDHSDPPWVRAWPRGLPRRMHALETTLDRNLAQAAERYPGKAATVFFDRVQTYAQMQAQSDALAGYLRERAGVLRGDRVLLMAQNCPQWIVAFHAIVRCGAVVVPVNVMSKPPELAHYVQDSGARVALIAQDLLPAIQQELDRERLSHAVALTYSDAIDAGSDLALPAWVAAPRAALDHPRLTHWSDAIGAGLPPPPHDFGPDDLCLLPYTSGTTGRPKGCMHTHRTLLAATVGACLWRNVHAESVIMGVAPMFHLLGMQNAMLMPIAVGATTVVQPRWDAANAARLIERYRVSVWAAPPAMLNDFFLQPDAHTRDLSSLAVLNGGGAAMPPAVARTLKERHDQDYIEGYGMTETASFLHCNPPARGKRLCLGIPAFGVDSRIVDPGTLQELPVGETGELVTAAPQLMLGYWRDDAANALSFFEHDGKRFFRTGDLACMDEEGYFFMRDRIKRMVNVSGYKVWPAELESLIYEHPAIAEACIVSVPDDRQGESIKAVLVLKPDSELDADGLVAWCRERMAAYKVPRHVEFRDHLPKSSTGKILWREIQAQQQ